MLEHAGESGQVQTKTTLSDDSILQWTPILSIFCTLAVLPAGYILL